MGQQFRLIGDEKFALDERGRDVLSFSAADVQSPEPVRGCGVARCGRSRVRHARKAASASARAKREHARVSLAIRRLTRAPPGFARIKK